MRQYEIWWANLPRPIGRRPVMLLSRDTAYEYLSRVIVVEVTSTIRSIPVEVQLGRPEGLSRRCVANFDNVHVIPGSSLDPASELSGRTASVKRSEPSGTSSTGRN